MAYYSCMAVGINRYRYLQPLSYALDDAQALQQLLVEELEILFPQEFLLLTDASPWIGEQPTYPSQKNILKWLNHEYQIEWESDPPSTLWFFFSGYGVTWENKDYLMPIEGNPATPQTSAIETGILLNALQKQGAEKVVVILDINRPPATSLDSVVGANTIGLAKEMGIPLILSCQLDEFSHESAALGQSMFTAALLEALRYHRQDLTLTALEEHLHQRLPVLCEHHGRPTQNPLLVIPNLDISRELILPNPGQRKLGLETHPAWETSAVYSSVSESVNNSVRSNVGTSAQGNGTTKSDTHTSKSTIVEPRSDSSIVTMSNNSNPQEQDKLSKVTSTPEETGLESNGIPLWQEWLIWGGSGLLVVAAIVAGLFFSKREAPQQVEQPPESTVVEQVESPSESSDSSESRNSEAESSQGENPPVATAPANTAPPAEAVETTAESVPPKRTAAVDKQPDKKEVQEKEEVAAGPELGTEEGNQAVLNQARTYIDGNQATGFQRAIEEASKIPPRTPLYRQASKEINRWRLVILDIAQGRAAQGNFTGAIAAAKLLTEEEPTASPSLYETARESIEGWELQAQQQEVNQAVITAAKAMVIPTQASSYNAAIEKLREIPQGQPGYAQARELTNGWSEQIYLIANSRASRGEFSGAVAAAKLVPSDSSIYEKTAAALARWEQGNK